MPLLSKSASPPRLERRAARRRLSSALGPDTAARVVARADAEYPAIAAQIPLTRAGARDLLKTSAYTIALHRSLVETGIDPDEANSLISDAVFAAILPARTTIYRLAALRHRDPLERARWGAGVTRRFYYTGPDWVMNDVDVDEGFGFDVTRCVIAEFYQAFGMSELCQRAICDQDLRSASHHGVVLERSQTLAAGGDRCDFRYRPPESHRAAGDGQAGWLSTVRPWKSRHRSRSQSSAGVLEDTIEIDAPPDQVWAWLTALADHYRDWHPDHVSAEWTRGAPDQIGSRLTAVENLGGHHEQLTFEMTEIDPPRRLAYRIVGPHSILVPGGAFEITPRGERSAFRATIQYRFGRLTRVLLARRINALHTHMREEGENLKRLLETNTNPPPAISSRPGAQPSMRSVGANRPDNE